MRGTLIAFEGIDGCGKTTQVDRAVAWLRDRGADPLLVREPGGTRLGERVRSLLLDPHAGDMTASAEALLYAASRAELVATVVEPALAAGHIVIADRFVDSSLAYQGAGRALGVARVLAANRLALGTLMPDLTVLLRIDPTLAAVRRDGGGAAADRIEAAGDNFFERVAAAYDELADAEPERFAVIDATADIEAVFGRVVAALELHVSALKLPAGGAA